MTSAYTRAVREFIGDADRQAAERTGKRLNKGVALAQLLAEKTGRQYQPSSVRAWMRGDATPPADVLMAIAGAVGGSLDRYLGLEMEPDEVQRQLTMLGDRVSELEERREMLPDALARWKPPEKSPEDQLSVEALAEHVRGLENQTEVLREKVAALEVEVMDLRSFLPTAAQDEQTARGPSAQTG